MNEEGFTGISKVTNAKLSRPLVSVIIPAFNAASTVGDAIKSATSQSYKYIEIIVIDDGSVDTTSSVVQACMENDSRVELLRKSNKGVSSAFNTGVAAAKGEFIARLDADDLWHPTKIEKQVEVALREPAAALIYTFVRYIDSKGHILRDVAPQQFPSRALCRGIYENLVGANSSAMVRRSVVVGLGGYDESLSSWEDLVLNLQISEQHPISFVPEYLVGYRLRPQSLSASPDNMHSSWQEARSRLLAHFPQVPRYVQGWGHARKCGELAEGFAAQGRYGRAIQLLLVALRFDPEWTLLHFTHLLRRKFMCREGLSDSSCSFLQCSPTDSIRSDEFARCPQKSLLRRYHDRRVKILEQLDRNLVTSMRQPGRA